MKAEKNKKSEKLADLIEKNPNCKFDIDNDAWYIMKDGEILNDEDYEKMLIAKDGDFEWKTEWYGHSGNYGFGLAEALVILLNRRGFNIKAQAV